MVKNMNKIYVALLVVGAVFGAFVCGGKIADTKCQMRFAQTSKTQIEQSLYNNRILDDKVYKTGVADIRRILQSEYSIAE